MPEFTASFTFNGATITVQKPTVAARVRLWQLRQAISEHGSGTVPSDIADTLVYYLVNTVKVEGSLGFPVPVSSPTHADLVSFLQGFAVADEKLITLWDETLYGLKYVTNDPDLLPPDAVGEKKDKILKSSSNG